MAEGRPSLSPIPFRLDCPGGGCDLVQAVIVEELRADLQRQRSRGQGSEAPLLTCALKSGSNPRF